MLAAINSLSDALVHWVKAAIADKDGVPVLMLSGAQGIGKTTALQGLVGSPELRVAVLALDDFYLKKAERAALADRIHPLCATRGAPGTHDVELLAATIEALSTASDGAMTQWPAFDKTIDDRAAEVRQFHGRPDAVLVEGWMIGALPDAGAAESAPLNAVEAEEDPAGLWRGWQEKALASDYLSLWRQADAFMHLLAPDFGVVFDWRCEQEETTLGLAKGTLPDERRDWVARFIQHYERITRRMLEGRRMPGATVELDAGRNVTRIDL